MSKTIWLLLPVLLLATLAKTQTPSHTFNVSDSAAVTYNGLQAGYTIKDESEKSVGKKGDFSRYKIYFYLTNTGAEARIMYKHPTFMGHAGPISNIIALFKCTNATGARLTNKMASMELQPCKIQATVEDKECGTDKIVQNTRLVDIGFWIRPGETVSKTYPMIVPLGEKPNVTITFYSEVANQVGTFITSNTDPQQQADESFAHIKNFSSNNYLHNQNGPLTCSAIDNGWWSAQWTIVPVAGTNNFQIRNRWKNNFISIANSDLMSDDGQSTSSMWTIQETATANVFYIKNVSNGARLYADNGMLRVSNNFISNDNTSKWIIEK